MAKTEFKFKKISRYDESRAQAGEWTTVFSEWDESFGRFKVGLQDVTSARVKVAYKHLERTQAEQLKHLNEEDRRKFLFVHICLFDWEGILDPNDKPVPFTKEAAFEYMKAEDYVFEILNQFSLSVKNFGNDPRASKDEAAGN